MYKYHHTHAVSQTLRGFHESSLIAWVDWNYIGLTCWINWDLLFSDNASCTKASLRLRLSACQIIKRRLKSFSQHLETFLCWRVNVCRICSFPLFNLHRVIFPVYDQEDAVSVSQDGCAVIVVCVGLLLLALLFDSHRLAPEYEWEVGCRMPRLFQALTLYKELLSGFNLIHLQAHRWVSWVIDYFPHKHLLVDSHQSSCFHFSVFNIVIWMLSRGRLCPC